MLQVHQYAQPLLIADGVPRCRGENVPGSAPASFHRQRTSGLFPAFGQEKMVLERLEKKHPPKNKNKRERACMNYVRQKCGPQNYA